MHYTRMERARNRTTPMKLESLLPHRSSKNGGFVLPKHNFKLSFLVILVYVVIASNRTGLLKLALCTIVSAQYSSSSASWVAGLCLGCRAMIIEIEVQRDELTDCSLLARPCPAFVAL
jgi:hypothetical protein